MFLSHYIALFTSIFTTYLLGHLFLSSVKRDKEYSNISWIFFKLLSGFVLSTVGFACVKSNFLTVYLIIFLLICIGFLYLKSQNQINFSRKIWIDNLKKIEYKELSFVFLLSLIVFFLQYNKLFDLSGNMLRIHYDTAFYAQVGQFISQSGKETLMLDTLNQENNPPVFYHYFGIWFGVLFANLFNLNILNALVLVSHSLMITLVITGSAVLLQQRFGFSLKKSFLFALPILFLGHFWTAFGAEKTFITPGFVLSALRIQKLGTVYISLLFFLILLNKKQLFARIFPLCLMFLLYGSTLPVVFTGIFFYLLYYIFTKQEKSKKELLFSFSALIIPVLGIVLFYDLIHLFHFPSVPDSSQLIEKRNLMDRIDSLLGTLVFFFNKISYYIVILFIPILILIYLIYKKELSLKQIWEKYAVMFFVLLTGLILHSLTNKEIDSDQLFLNIAFPFVSIFVFLTTIALFFSNSIFRKIIAVLIVFLHFYCNFSFHETHPIDRKYYEEIADIIKEGNNRYAYLFDKNTLMNGSVVRNANVIYADYDITRFTNDYHPVFLNSFDLLEITYNNNPLYIKASVINTPFYHYVMTKKENNIKKTILEYQVDFIKENNIRFLITDKNNESLIRLPFKIKRIVESDTENFWFVEIYLK